MRRVIFLAAFLCACSPFAPPYQAEADASASRSFEATSEILARVELGQYETPRSYPAAIDDYVKAISAMETARLLVSSAPADAAPAEAAKDAQLQVVDACLANIKTLADMHKSLGLVPGSGVTQPVRVTCDQAVRTIQALR